MQSIFGLHAEFKFQLLKKRGFPVSRQQVLDCVQNPDTIETGYRNRKIAQKDFDKGHVLRVVFEEKDGVKRIITFYPGSKKRYENKL